MFRNAHPDRPRTRAQRQAAAQGPPSEEEQHANMSPRAEHERQDRDREVGHHAHDDASALNTLDAPVSPTGDESISLEHTAITERSAVPTAEFGPPGNRGALVARAVSPPTQERAGFMGGVDQPDAFGVVGLSTHPTGDVSPTRGDVLVPDRRPVRLQGEQAELVVVDAATHETDPGSGRSQLLTHHEAVHGHRGGRAGDTRQLPINVQRMPVTATALAAESREVPPTAGVRVAATHQREFETGRRRREVGGGRREEVEQRLLELRAELEELRETNLAAGRAYAYPYQARVLGHDASTAPRPRAVPIDSPADHAYETIQRSRHTHAGPRMPRPHPSQRAHAPMAMRVPGYTYAPSGPGSLRAPESVFSEAPQNVASALKAVRGFTTRFSPVTNNDEKNGLALRRLEDAMSKLTRMGYSHETCDIVFELMLDDTANSWLHRQKRSRAERGLPDLNYHDMLHVLKGYYARTTSSETFLYEKMMSLQQDSATTVAEHNMAVDGCLQFMPEGVRRLNKLSIRTFYLNGLASEIRVAVKGHLEREGLTLADDGYHLTRLMALAESFDLSTGRLDRIKGGQGPLQLAAMTRSNAPSPRESGRDFSRSTMYSSSPRKKKNTSASRPKPAFKDKKGREQAPRHVNDEWTLPKCLLHTNTTNHTTVECRMLAERYEAGRLKGEDKLIYELLLRNARASKPRPNKAAKPRVQAQSSAISFASSRAQKHVDLPEAAVDDSHNKLPIDDDELIEAVQMGAAAATKAEADARRPMLAVHTQMISPSSGEKSEATTMGMTDSGSDINVIGLDLLYKLDREYDTPHVVDLVLDNGRMNKHANGFAVRLEASLADGSPSRLLGAVELEVTTVLPRITVNGTRTSRHGRHGNTTSSLSNNMAKTTTQTFYVTKGVGENYDLILGIPWMRDVGGVSISFEENSKDSLISLLEIKAETEDVDVLGDGEHGDAATEVESEDFLTLGTAAITKKGELEPDLDGGVVETTEELEQLAVRVDPEDFALGTVYDRNVVDEKDIPADGTDEDNKYSFKELKEICLEKTDPSMRTLATRWLKENVDLLEYKALDPRKHLLVEPVVVHAKDDAVPQRASYRPRSRVQLKLGIAVLKKLERYGVLKRVTGKGRLKNLEWISEVILIDKKGSKIGPHTDPASVRVVVDLRAVNSQLADVALPIVLTREALDRIPADHVVFWCTDLCKGFCQALLAQISQKYFTLRFGHLVYQFERMPQGWKGAPGTFQFIMANEVIFGPHSEVSREFVHIFVDDVLCSAPTMEVLFDQVTKLCAAFRAKGATLKAPKMQAFTREALFLGVKLKDGQVLADPEKVRVLTEMPRPTTVAALRRTLGVFTYFSTHIVNFAPLAAPMQQLLVGREVKKNDKTSIVADWREEQEASFTHLREVMTKHPVVLTRPTLKTRAYVLYADAQPAGGGALLFAVKDDMDLDYYMGFTPADPRHLEPEPGKELILAAVNSWRWKHAETRWSVARQEMVAIERALKKNKHLLFGCRVLAFSDNTSAIVGLTAPTGLISSSKLALLRDELLSFNLVVRKVAGSHNLLADYCSREGLPPKQENFLTVYDDDQRRLPLEEPWAKDAPPMLRDIYHAGGKLLADCEHCGEVTAFTDFNPDISWSEYKARLHDKRAARNDRDVDDATNGAVDNSCLSINALTLGVGKGSKIFQLDREQLLEEQEHDRECLDLRDRVNAYLHAVEHQLKVEVEQTPAYIRALDTEDDGLLIVKYRKNQDAKWVRRETPLLYIPESMRHPLIERVHAKDCAHAGKTRTTEALTRFAWWRGCTAQIKDFVESCQRCARARLKYPTVKSGFAPTPKTAFEVMHVDAFGPVTSEAAFQGLRYVIGAVDPTTGFLLAQPVRSLKADVVVYAVDQMLATLPRIPKVVVADNGPPFNSAAFALFLSERGCKVRPVAAYRPQANGLIERKFKDLGAKLRALCERTDGVDWVKRLPDAVRAMNFTPRDDAGVNADGDKLSPAEVLFGHADAPTATAAKDILAGGQDLSAKDTAAEISRNVQAAHAARNLAGEKRKERANEGKISAVPLRKDQLAWMRRGRARTGESGKLGDKNQLVRITKTPAPNTESQTYKVQLVDGEPIKEGVHRRFLTPFKHDKAEADIPEDAATTGTPEQEPLTKRDEMSMPTDTPHTLPHAQQWWSTPQPAVPSPPGFEGGRDEDVLFDFSSVLPFHKAMPMVTAEHTHGHDVEADGTSSSISTSLGRASSATTPTDSTASTRTSRTSMSDILTELEATSPSTVASGTTENSDVLLLSTISESSDTSGSSSTTSTSHGTDNSESSQTVTAPSLPGEYAGLDLEVDDFSRDPSWKDSSSRQ